MKLIKSNVLLGLLVASPFSYSEPMNHDNIGLTYVQAGDKDIDLAAFLLEGEKAITENLFVTADYARVRDKKGFPAGYSYNATAIGLGVFTNMDLSPNVEIYGGFEITQTVSNFNDPYGKNTDKYTYKNIAFGVVVSTSAFYQAGATFLRDVGEDDNENGLKVHARVFPVSSISIGLGYELRNNNGDYSGVELSIRYDLD